MFAPLSKHANEQMRLKPTVQEWGLVVVALILVKLATQLYSAYGAYNYFMLDFFLPLADYESRKLATIFVLLMIEMTVAGFLFRFWKFTFLKKYRIAAFALLATLGAYSYSVYTSVQGLRTVKTQEVDRSAELEAKAEKNKELALLQLNTVIAEKQAIIDFENKNPQGWLGNVRVYQTEEQNKRKYYAQNSKDSARAVYEAKLRLIDENLQNQMLLNASQKEDVSTLFSNRMYGVLALQFIVNGLIAMFFYLIRIEEKPEEVNSEIAEELRRKSQMQVQDYFVYSIQQEFERMNRQLQFTPFPQLPNPVVQNTTPSTAPEINPALNAAMVGFNAVRKPAEADNATSNEVRNASRYEVEKQENPEAGVGGIGVCPACGKKFTRNAVHHIYCSDNCRINHWTEKTGKEFIPNKPVQTILNL